MMNRHFLKITALVLSAIALCLLLTACGEGKMTQEKFWAMGTDFTVTAYGSNAAKGISSAQSTILAIDAMSNPLSETSTCYSLNHAQGNQLNISGQIAEMLIDAKDVYEKSGGAYDLTVYPLVKRWGFDSGRFYIPTDDEIAADLSRLCMDKLSIAQFPSSGTYAVSLPSYGELSFASCARGCAAKYGVDALRKSGVDSAIISLAGNVQTLGMKPDGTEWKVGITDPQNTESYLGVVSVGETAVVTTGAYQKLMTGNPKYHHILNPATGYPTSNSLLSVTVVCSDGTMADCLSTAMYALGENKALNYWRANGGFEMIMITDSGEIICTSGLLEKFDIKNDFYVLNYVE